MNPDGPDPAAPDRAQSYIAHVATRALIFIEAPKPVGTADISTYEVTVNPSDTVSIGQEIEMFHHGRSTPCLLFWNGVNFT
ncbi:hypothetical protein BDV38DRAFT_250705 [Aspergillus pseudotamarii]|uniref:Uncharacterized protein n=1 Tax=Aspergillus pseudotamarii TaxID=132259 RepID=A0A5N6SMK7_ASPPS|nr:uncharacterized protein BDV38DRAFT_250705 [Aspergillus pseudotamarii]KAE8135912.1 hypothetical protein BDV38DRAFT_250705 [Aspergillus pseudotamarii]